MPRRSLAATALAWVLTLAVLAVVALPERCPDLSAAGARAAAVETVRWFERNQLPDGRWVYAHDRRTGSDELVPHLVRHAGVTMSLYQAHAAGIEGALEVADRGTEWALAQGVDAGGGTALTSGGRTPTGGAALLAAGLALRKDATGDERYDDELRALATFLVATIEDSGAVLAEWDLAAGAPVPDLYSLFFTGELLWALVLVDRVGIEGDWRGPVRQVAHYVATERDHAEEWFPPVSDHWGALALGDLGLDLLAEGDRLDPDEIALARRLAGIFGIQIRYESQRTGEGLNLLLRGDTALGSGVGTLGEGLGALWALAGADDRLDDLRPVIAERLRCVAGVLADRQVSAEEAAALPDPDRARGAWFTGDRTQKDDQQHALSALLLAEGALAEVDAHGDPGRVTGASDTGTDGLLWLLVVLVAVANPVRAARRLAGVHRRDASAASAVLGGVLVLAAVSGPTVTDVLRVSPPTLVIAAAIAVLATGAVDLARRAARALGPARTGGTSDPTPTAAGAASTGPAGAAGAGSGGADTVRADLPEAAPGVLPAALVLVRPAQVLSALALGAHLGPLPGAVLGLLTAAALGAVVTGRVPIVPAERRVEGALARAVGALALAGGLTLVVTGTMSP